MRHAYAMTYDHLHAYDIFTFDITKSHKNVAKWPTRKSVCYGCGCFMQEKKTSKGMRSLREEMVTAKMGERGFPAVDGGTTFRRRIKRRRIAFIGFTGILNLYRNNFLRLRVFHFDATPLPPSFYSVNFCH